MTLPSNLVPLPAELKYVFQSIQTLERWRCKGTEGEGMETGLGATYPLWMPHPPGNSTSPSVFEHSNLALWTFREASLHLAQARLIKPLATGDQISSQALSPEVVCRTEKKSPHLALVFAVKGFLLALNILETDYKSSDNPKLWLCQDTEIKTKYVFPNTISSIHMYLVVCHILTGMNRGSISGYHLPGYTSILLSNCASFDERPRRLSRQPTVSII